MRMKQLSRMLVPWAVLLVLPLTTHAQGTQADYRRAMELDDRLDGLVINDPEEPEWIEAAPRFWYRKSVEGGDEFALVDAETEQKRPAFDHGRLATSLSAETGESYTAVTLPFRTFEFVDEQQAIEFEAENAVWQCSLSDYACTHTGERPERGFRGGRGRSGPEAEAEMESQVSPDGTLEATVRNYNIHVRAVGAEEWRALSQEATEGDAYEARSIVWSPDSRKIAAYRVNPGYERTVYYIDSAPDDQLQPRLISRTYTKPGDVLDVEQAVLFDVETGRQVVVDNTLFPNAYSMSELEWREDSRAFAFEYNQRGHQVYRVIEVDAETGQARALISEEPETFFAYREANGSQRDSGKRFRHDVADGREIIWMSERDGWNHLYLYDGVTGEVKHQITQGEWVVRAVDHVDEENRQIWFRASGMDPEEDPYFVHAYRINFDGSGLTPLTQPEGNHDIAYSDDMRYLVDTWSRVDLPPILVLRHAADGGVVMELERADASRLYETGWQPPEVFVAKGRDGESDIWGIIVRPTNFDPEKTYPVIEYIYAGPQGSFVPKSFTTLSSLQAQAELGFIVVQIDGMGTSNRSKAFHDVIWRNLGDAGFPDRILWHEAVAARYPYYDITRVGIYGTSAGGQSALGALLFHPEFYDAAVSAAGSHDNRVDKIWWNEQWMGWPLGPHYAASSNAENAHRLQGKLLLVVGELDTNVDPAATLQVVDALIKANKNFDLLFLPGEGHTSGGDYGERKRFDFFVHHLLGVEPPDWNRGILAEVAS